MWTRFDIAVCAVGVFLAVAPPDRTFGSALPRYRARMIEHTSGTYSYSGINDSSQLAVTALPPGSEIARRWDPHDGFLELAPANSYATAINNHGSVTVVREVPPFGFQSFLWTEADGLIQIDGLGGDRTNALAVNDGGQVVGVSGDSAFLWTKKAGTKSLGRLPGEQSSVAYDVTNGGLVVGRSQGLNGQLAFRWSEEGGIEGLGDLAGGTVASAAWAANERGQVVGYGTIGEDHEQAVIWNPDGEIRNLGTLRPGDDSAAEDINDHGQVVGWSVPHPGGPQIAYVPFIWTEEHGMVDLNELLDHEGVAWQLTGLDMGGINNRGEILLWGYRDGQFGRVLLTPIPEPAAVSTCVVGALLLLQRRRTLRGCAV